MQLNRFVGDGADHTRAHRLPGDFQKRDLCRRKVAARRTTDKAHIAVHAHRLGQPVTHEQLGHCPHSGLGMKVGSHLGAEGDRGAFIHGVEDFHHVLSLAIRISRHGGGILTIQLPMAHRRRPLQRLLQVGQLVGDASGLLQDARDRPAGAWQALALQRLIARKARTGSLWAPASAASPRAAHRASG